MSLKTLFIRAFIFILFFNLTLINAQAPFGNAGDHTRVELGTSNLPFGYYEYLPVDFSETSGQTYAVIISYHGYGQRGNGTSELSNVVSTGPAKLVNQGNDLPTIVISPQNSDANYNASDFLTIYNYLIANYPIDTDRVYVTGLSSGGGSTWKALIGHSDKIAAAIPVCGWVVVDNPSEYLQETPIWAFHSFNDTVILVDKTITNMNRISNTGNSIMNIYPYQNGDDAAAEDYSFQFDTTTQAWSLDSGTSVPLDKLTFTLYKDGGHDSWTRAYNNTIVWDWLFAQSLNNVLNINEEEVIDFKLYPNPASEKVNIITNTNSEKKIEIYNLAGVKIYNNIFYKELTVDISTYASGVYFAKFIDSNNNQRVEKILVN